MLMIFLSILAFLVIFSLVILVHEWGHFASARRHGVHVEEFSLGLPPKARILWKDKKGCEYTLNWIPFGGFVRMEGEDAVDEKVRKSKGSFATKSLSARMEIVLAGVFMNFVLAIGILTILFTIGSKPILLNQEAVMKNVEQGIIILDEGIPVLALEEGPAKTAGLQVGDLVLSVNGQKAMSAQQISDLQVPNTFAEYMILRENPASHIKEQEILRIQANGDAKIKVAFSSLPMFKEIKNISFPVHKALWYSLKTSGEIAVATVEAFKKLVVRLVTQAEVPAGISGPVGIAAMTHGIVIQGSLDALFKFVALLSLSLAIMNVLPIPALDGGRFFFLLVEAIVRKPIKAEWEAKIHSAAFILLLGLIIVVTGNDVYKIVIGMLG